MTGLDPLVCIVCVAMVDATSEDAEGWVLAPSNVDDGDERDDPQWRCPEHATPSDDLAAVHDQRAAYRSTGGDDVRQMLGLGSGPALAPLDPDPDRDD